jgi:Tol biopolymer transport system component
MTERWQTLLERIDRLHPDDDLLERGRHRPTRPEPDVTPGRRAGAIVVAAVLTVGLAAGGYLALRDRGSGVSPVEPAPEAPVNGDLLYATPTGEGWHVFALDPETGVDRELTHGVRDYGSDWSSDATKIVYDTDDGQIVVADADGSNPVAIGDGSEPAWSPDGARIAYTGEDGAIWIANADGSDAHAITDPTSSGGETMSLSGPYDWHASWSPDGRSIAYSRTVADRLVPTRNGAGNVGVFLEELRVWSEGEADVALTDEYWGIGDIDWSPDGTTIAFTGAPTLFHEETTDASAGIWPQVRLIPSTGGEVTTITPERERWIGGVTWSPDGEWLAFQDDYETISIVRPDGSDLRQIELGYEIIGISWGVKPSE